MVIQLRRTGRFDATFANDGRRRIRRMSNAAALAIQPNGRIVVVGDWATFTVARLRRDGDLDPSFGRSGVARIPDSLIGGISHAQDVAIQPDGRIVVAGYASGPGGVTADAYLVLARFLRDGRLDPSFSDDGFLYTKLGFDETYVAAYGLALQDDGKLVVSGEIGNGWFLARFLADGTLDPSFGNEAGLQRHEPIGAGQANDVAIQPDGRIVAAGTSYDAAVRFGVARYLPDGTPDPTFGGDGAVETSFHRPPPEDYGNALAIQPDGRIVVAGTTELPPKPNDGQRLRFAIARYRPGGALDRSFSEDGKVLIKFHRKARSSDNIATSVAQRGRKIVVVGETQPYRRDSDMAIARYWK